MKIVALFFAYVALLNFAKVGAMDNGRQNDGRAPNPEMVGVPYREPHPDLPAWNEHHYSEVYRHATSIPWNLPQRHIVISRVVNGGPSEYHFLMGNLLPDSDITSCNSPYGYAIVNLRGSETLYSCLKPKLYHDEYENSRQTGGLPEFTAHITLEQGVPHRILEAVLTTGDAATTLVTTSRKFSSTNRRAIGHVRYIKTDLHNPANSIDADGDVYVYEGRRSLN